MTLSDTDTAQLWETFRAGGGAELVRDAVRLVLQELIEAEATEAIGAGRYERSDARVNERNGHRPRLLATQAGDVELRIPKLARGRCWRRCSSRAGASTGRCTRSSCSASEFDAEMVPRIEPTLAGSRVDLRGVSCEREWSSSAAACAVAGGEVGDLLEVTSREITQAEAARRHSVDVSTVIGIRRTVKDAALAALAARPGRRAKERNWELEQAQREVAQLTEAVKSQAIELALLRGKAGWA